MKKTFQNTIKVSLVASALFLAPLSGALAAGCTGSSSPTPSGTLPNPLCVSSVSDILYLAVDIATYVGVVLAVVFLIYAGFKYIAAQGNSEKIKEAHHFLLSVVIGIAILIGASAIVTVIKNTLTSAGLVNSSTFNTPGT